MKKRILCRVCILTCGILFLLYTAGDVRIFRELQPSVWEQNLSEGQKVLVQGRVFRKVLKENGAAWYLDEVEVQEGMPEGKKRWKSREHLLVHVSSHQMKDASGTDRVPAIGQKVLMSGTVTFFQEAPNPGNFNTKFYYQKQKIHAGIEDAVLIRAVGKKDLFRESMQKLREFLAEQIKSGARGEDAGVLCAMLLGEKQFLDKEIKELYQRSGIGHLLATSGLHASFFGVGIYEVLRKMHCSSKISAVLSGGVLVFYTVITGGSVSAVRACVMFLVRMGAVISGREHDGLTSLSLACILTLCKNPLQMFDAGFLLSYGAVLGIYGMAFLVEEKGRSERRSGRCPEKKKRTESLQMSLAVQVILLPVMTYYYFEVNICSVLWNLLAIPAAGGVLGAGVLGLFSMVLNVNGGSVLRYLARFFFGIAGVILQFYETGSRIVIKLPGTAFVAGQSRGVQIVCYYLAVSGYMLIWYKKNEKTIKKKSRMRYARLSQVILLVFALGILCFPHGRRGEAEILMLDVGQGDCFFIRGPKGGTYMIDGGSSTETEVGRYRIEPCLKSQGVGTLDYVWVTHADEDHLSGIREMILRQNTGVKIRHLVLPEEAYWDEKLKALAVIAKEQEIPVVVMEQGKALKEGDMTLTCIFPAHIQNSEKLQKEEQAGRTGNEASLVLSLHMGEFDMLFTGDLEKEGEASFCRFLREEQKRGRLPAAYDVLKAGHHGSRNATGEELLELLSPSDVFLSAGEGNRYGHPHEETVERLAKRKISLYNTKDRNAVKLCTDGKKYCILRP